MSEVRAKRGFARVPMRRAHIFIYHFPCASARANEWRLAACGQTGMIRERNEWLSTGAAESGEERNGHLLLGAVPVARFFKKLQYGKHQALIWFLCPRVSQPGRN